MKKIISLLLLVVMSFSICTNVMAAESSVDNNVSTYSVGPQIDSDIKYGPANKETRITLHVDEDQYNLHFHFGITNTTNTEFRVSVIYPDETVATFGTFTGDGITHKFYEDRDIVCPKGDYTFVFAPREIGDNDELVGFVASIYSNF